MTHDAVVLVERRGALGMLTLNRPRAINALTHEMVTILRGALEDWAHDDDIATVVVTGAGERGLCAGGDIVSLHTAAVSGEYEAAARFWADEYRLNAQLATYPKPVVAVQDGIVLGGGIGVSAHCSHRVVTERSRLGLPEVGIGFVPDVGATWLLSRAPGESGTAVALAARHVGAADALLLGLSDAFVPAAHLDTLITALADDEPDAVLSRFGEEAPAGALAQDRAWIDHAFAAGDVLEILARARAVGEPAADLVAAIERASPVAVTVTLEALRRAASDPSLDAALVREYRTSMHALTTPDFAEGVRAQVIEKDRRPRWRPSTLDAVDLDLVAPYFSAPPSGDLDLASKEMS